MEDRSVHGQLQVVAGRNAERDYVHEGDGCGEICDIKKIDILRFDSINAPNRAHLKTASSVTQGKHPVDRLEVKTSCFQMCSLSF